MAHLLFAWFILAVNVWLTAMLVPGIEVKGLGGALITAAVFGILNAAIGWLIFVLLGIASLGLGFLLAFVTRWVVNAILLQITSAVTSSLRVRSLGSALIGALVMSLLGTFAERWLHPWR